MTASSSSGGGGDRSRGGGVDNRQKMVALQGYHHEEKKEEDHDEVPQALVKVKRSWRAAALARAISARRAGRGPNPFPHRSAVQIMMHQASARDMKAFRALSYTIRGAAETSNELLCQTDQQYLVQRDLTRLSTDIRKMIALSRVKVERLKFVQNRLLDLRAQANGTRKHLSADEEVRRKEEGVE